MNNLQYIAIIVLATSAAISLFSFDKRGRVHKPLISVIAYCTFLQMGALALAAYLKADFLLEWLLISVLAVQVGGILLARGNVSKIYSNSQNKLPNHQFIQKFKRSETS